MAGIGHWPVPIPDTVKISEANGTLVAKGPKGELTVAIPSALAVQVAEGSVVVSRRSESRQAKALHGLTRKLIANVITGVSVGFSRTLEITGVGYRAEVMGDSILLNLGYSHPILYQLPPGVLAKIERQTIVTVEGIDKQLLGEVTAGIRRLRPPDPYKAKGIKYAGETIRRKAGKTAGAR